MNDFFFSTNPDDADLLESLIKRRCDDTCALATHSGPWGVFGSIHRISTAHTFIEGPDLLLMLLGSPSFLGRHCATPGAAENEPALAALVAQAFESQQTTCWKDHFNGPFALLAVQKSTGNVLLATDMLEFTPIYHTEYTQRGEPAFCCGTQINIVADLSGQSALDPVSIAECILFKTPTSPYTLLENIRTMPPASELRRGQDARLTIASYWLPVEPERIDFTLEECAAELRRITESNVRQVDQDYDAIGILLSGGSDSRVVASLLHGNPKVEALTFSESENRESALAERIAEVAELKFRLYTQNSDYYLDHIDACSELAGFDNFFIHSHVLSAWQRMGLHEKDVILGGFFSDVLLKGNQLPQKPLIHGTCLKVIDRKALAMPTNPALSPELQDAAHNRRQVYLDMLKAFRPRTYKEFEVVYSVGMDDALSYYAINRRFFNPHEVFSDNRVVELSCRTPYRWKINGTLFRTAFQDIFRLYRSVPHTSGMYCHLGSYRNMPYCIAATASRKIKILLNKLVRPGANVDPWRQSPNIVEEAARRSYFDADLNTEAFRDAVGGAIDVPTLIHSTPPKPLLFVMQIARYLQTHTPPSRS